MLSQGRLHTVCCLCVCRDLAGGACVQGSGCVRVWRHLVGDVYWQACVRGHPSGSAGAPDHQGKRVITLGHVNGARVRQIFTEHYTHPKPYEPATRCGVHTHVCAAVWHVQHLERTPVPCTNAGYLVAAGVSIVGLHVSSSVSRDNSKQPSATMKLFGMLVCSQAMQLKLSFSCPCILTNDAGGSAAALPYWHPTRLPVTGGAVLAHRLGAAVSCGAG
jgi:hypothetical protein